MALIKKRGQAAIFDGVTFLLLVSFSCALVYNFISSYGLSEDASLRSAYELNYLQSALKATYFLDAVTLADVGSDGVTVYTNSPSLDDGDVGCESLRTYSGGSSLVDLVKRDLSDTTDLKLDDSFGGISFVPGRQGLRCAMKELLKPLVYSGYDYFVEVGDVSDGGFMPKTVNDAKITNTNYVGCDVAQEKGERVLSMTSPFRVITTDATGDPDTLNLVFRLCVWPEAG